MILKHKIVEALEDSRTYFESPEMCFVTLNGGYENIVQTKLAFSLNNNRLPEEEYYLLERYNRTDIVCERPNIIKHQQNVTSCIELGHNGIFSPRENGVINHAIDNINERIHSFNTVYTVSILTIILDEGLNSTQVIQYYPRFKSYINNPTKINNQMNMILHDDEYFKRLDSNFIPLCFTTDYWNNYKSQIHMFVCGPFKTPIAKWW